MKKTLLIISALLVFIGLSAQSISLMDDDNNPISNDDIITLHEEVGHTDILSYLDVHNNSSSSMDILCKKTEINVVSGSSNTFCWTQCYPPFTFVSPTPITIPAGGADTMSFVGEYYPTGNDGTSTIAYTFFDENNADDSIRVIIEYAYNTVGLEDIFARGDYEFSPAYPNPASDQTNFNFDLPSNSNAYVSIMNLLGSEVKRLDLQGNQGKATLNTSDMLDGVYFYSLVVNNEAVSTHKLVIKR